GHAAGWAAAVAPLVAVSTLRVRALFRSGSESARALFKMAGALTFAVSLFPIPVPMVAATSHLCATPMLALLLGPLTMGISALASLLLQALFFAHGGLTSLGANTLTLGFIGPLTAVLTARLLRRLGVRGLVAIGIACAVGDAAVYLADAVILGIGLAGAQPF